LKGWIGGWHLNNASKARGGAAPRNECQRQRGGLRRLGRRQNICKDNGVRVCITGNQKEFTLNILIGLSQALQNPYASTNNSTKVVNGGESKMEYIIGVVIIAMLIFLYNQTITQQQAEEELHAYAIQYLNDNPHLWHFVLCKLHERAEIVFVDKHSDK
jgi:hypothetical protein